MQKKKKNHYHHTANSTRHEGNSWQINRKKGRKPNGSNTTAKPKSQNILFKILPSITGMGFIIAVRPKTEAILKILDPIRFPSESAFSFLSAAITEAASSGTLVPIAITVTDIA